jgi:hypothetical protein
MWEDTEIRQHIKENKWKKTWTKLKNKGYKKSLAEREEAGEGGEGRKKPWLDQSLSQSTDVISV